MGWHDLITERRPKSLEIALVIICGCIPTIKPVYDYFRNGTPVRPFRSKDYPSKRSYHMHSRTHDSGRTNTVSTDVTSNGMELEDGSFYRPEAGRDAEGIRVKREVEVDRGERYARGNAPVDHGIPL